jgi:hypothetical protein
VADGEVDTQVPPGLAAQTVEKKRSDIEAALGRFFGRPTRLTFTVAAPAAAEGAPAASIAQEEQAAREARSAQVRESARGNANIREAARILGGEIGKIEEL